MSGAAEKGSTLTATVAAQYETLRMAGFGGALPPEARSGLVIFLRRGMWAWARMLAAPCVREEPTQVPAPASALPCERKAIIYLLAAMAMNTRDRRAR